MITRTTLAAFVATATLSAAGLALAQATPPTSTAGNGCTATGNAMRGGNLGGPANPNINCATPGAQAATTTTTTETTTSQSGGSTSMAAPAATAQAEPAPAPRTRVARADRN